MYYTYIVRNRISFCNLVHRTVRLTRSVSCIFLSVMPAKRKSLCPGCETPKRNHAFAAPSKHCAGPSVKNKILDNKLSVGKELPPCQGTSVSPPSAKSSPQKQLELQQLLDTMWNLSLQLEGIKAEQTTIKKRMDEISARNAPKPTHEDASRCSGPGASNSLLPVKQAPKARHLPEKFVPATINGE